MNFLIAIALLSQPIVPLAEPPAQGQLAAPASNDAASVESEVVAMDQRPLDQVLICRERRRAGTRVAHTECYSRARANEAADVARETVELMLENSGHNNSE